jgi:hypothetical protein
LPPLLEKVELFELLLPEELEAGLELLLFPPLPEPEL